MQNQMILKTLIIVEVITSITNAKIWKNIEVRKILRWIVEAKVPKSKERKTNKWVVILDCLQHKLHTE
jgi:hypothetical protein